MQSFPLTGLKLCEPKVQDCALHCTTHPISCAGALFLIGLSLVSVGVYCFFNCAHSLGLFVIGFIALCPGAYSMVILVSYVCGVPGFHWHQLPDME